MSLTLLLTSPKMSSNVRVLSFHHHRDRTNDLGKVRNCEFLKKIMNSVKDKLADEEKELLEDEDPFSCV